MPRAQAIFGLAGLVLAIFIVLSVKFEPASISCMEVVADIVNCADFLELGSSETKPLPACCDGIKKLGGEVKDNPDLVDVCNCIEKDLDCFGNFGYNFGRMSELRIACGLSETFPPIDKSFNCSN